MTKGLKIIGSMNRNENEEVRKILKELSDVKVQWFVPCKLLDEIENLPMLRTDEGDRCFGVQDIKKLVQKEKKLRNIE